MARLAPYDERAGDVQPGGARVGGDAAGPVFAVLNPEPMTTQSWRGHSGFGEPLDIGGGLFRGPDPLGLLGADVVGGDGAKRSISE